MTATRWQLCRLHPRRIAAWPVACEAVGSMRVFMLGWEFPPFISGGLGTACYGLTKAMSAIGTDILFVLPRPVTTPFSTHLKLVSPRPVSYTHLRAHETG